MNGAATVTVSLRVGDRQRPEDAAALADDHRRRPRGPAAQRLARAGEHEPAHAGEVQRAEAVEREQHVLRELEVTADDAERGRVGEHRADVLDHDVGAPDQCGGDDVPSRPVAGEPHHPLATGAFRVCDRHRGECPGRGPPRLQSGSHPELFSAPAGAGSAPGRPRPPAGSGPPQPRTRSCPPTRRTRGAPRERVPASLIAVPPSRAPRINPAVSANAPQLRSSSPV